METSCLRIRHNWIFKNNKIPLQLKCMSTHKRYYFDIVRTRNQHLEIHFDTRVHMLLLWFTKLNRYENPLEKSQQIWAQTYASFQHKCKLLNGNDTLCGMCKKTKSVAKIGFKNTFFKAQILSILHRPQKVLFPSKILHEY